MDKTQAENKARELWGDDAFAIQDSNCWVGERNGPLRQFYGKGSNWEEAFEAAKLQLN